MVVAGEVHPLQTKGHSQQHNTIKFMPSAAVQARGRLMGKRSFALQRHCNRLQRSRPTQTYLELAHTQTGAEFRTLQGAPLRQVGERDGVRVSVDGTDWRDCVGVHEERGEAMRVWARTSAAHTKLCPAVG